MPSCGARSSCLISMKLRARAADPARTSDPIERLWGLMHKHITHNKCHVTFKDFSDAILTFLREA